MERKEKNKKLNEASYIIFELEQDANREGYMGFGQALRKINENIRSWII